MTTYREVITRYTNLCRKEGLEEHLPLSLMVELCHLSRSNLYMSMDEVIAEEVYAQFQDAFQQLLLKKPLAYVLGYSWFYGHRFIVNEHVLIPRSETEELVGHCLSLIDTYFASHDVVDVLDVATGSGAIGISLALEEKRVKATLSDICPDALLVAQENSEQLQADVTCICSDMLDGIDHQVDLLVCNPPYIPSGEQLDESVVNYEPSLALFGKEDGLYFYRRLLSDCRRVLKKNGMIALEMGYDQKQSLTDVVTSYFPKAVVEVKKDMNGHDRMMFIQLD